MCHEQYIHINNWRLYNIVIYKYLLTTYLETFRSEFIRNHYILFIIYIIHLKYYDINTNFYFFFVIINNRHVGNLYKHIITYNCLQV